MTMQSGDRALVTGVSGYLASWLAKYLLADGIKVRGTVRSLSDTTKVDALRKLLPGVELVEADLRSKDGWAAAVEGCRWVFHVASPQAVPSEKDRTGGAMQGTEYLIRAALSAASVEKIVLTSSEAAIAYGFPRSKPVFTEDDWTVLDGPAGRNDYFRSKTMAERLAWKLVRDPAVNPRRIPMAVINPSFIAGPSLVPWGRFSLETVRGVATGAVPMLPDMVNRIVDVRDCARMHIALMNDASTNGHRHFSFAIVGRMSDLAEGMKRSYPGQGLAKKVGVAPRWLVGLLGLVSGDAASIYSKIGSTATYKTLYPGVYAYRYTNMDEVIRASIDSMIEHGWLKLPV